LVVLELIRRGGNPKILGRNNGKSDLGERELWKSIATKEKEK
jgi:hypothetical protein